MNDTAHISDAAPLSIKLFRNGCCLPSSLKHCDIAMHAIGHPPRHSRGIHTPSQLLPLANAASLSHLVLSRSSTCFHTLGPPAVIPATY